MSELRNRDLLAWGALLAALTVTASAEYGLARDCGFGEVVAAGVPAAVDIYAVRALRAHQDVPAVVVVMIAVNAAAHLVAAHLLPVNVGLVVAVSALAPLVLWRVHRIGHRAPVVNTEVHDPASTDERPELDAAPAPAELPDVKPVDTPDEADESTETERLSTDAAREVIEHGWETGLSIRETAAAATRSPSFVSKVFTQLEDERGPRPVPGQLALVDSKEAA